MRLCAAQCRSVAGDIEQNVLAHIGLVNLAASHGADLVLFPELSLSGYEPGLAKDLAADPLDPRLDVFQQVSDARGIIIGAGLPTAAPDRPRISMILFQPGKVRQAYSKQQLHADELPYFTCGDGQPVLQAGRHTLAPAICYESLQPEHAAHAARLGADVYLASVAKHARGVVQAYAHYSAVARKHSMTVLMANCVGPCDDFVAASQSAVWNNQGELAGQITGAGEGLILMDTATGAVRVVEGS